eukprot:COSAG01_NODE_17917_length_1114_cov_2.438424_2_plen_99_part_00
MPQVDNEATCRVCAHNPDKVVRRPRLGLAKHVMAKSGLEVYDLGDDGLAPHFCVVFPHIPEMFHRSRCFFAQCCVHWSVGLALLLALLALPALPALLR